MSVANDTTAQPQEQQQQQQHQDPAPQQAQPVHIVVNIRHAPQSECVMKTTASAATAAAAQQASSSDGVKKKVKRNVALHIGYVGTNYTGLQANRQLPELSTIEGVLEEAIYKAGMITEANFGDFRKTKWSRSSRTDKGVHSLATVIGLRILMHDEDYDTDCEGIKYARAINQHLPDDVCVFAVQRTNKSFNARRWCGSRTYEYYLPAAALGLDTPDGSSAGDQAKMALLREVLGVYCGYRPFQNYAGNRSQYVGQREKALAKKARREARAAAASSASETEEDSSSAAATATQSTDADTGPTSTSSTAAAAEAATATATATATQKSQGKQGRKGAKAGAVSDDGEESDAEAAAEAALYAAVAADPGYSGEGPVPPEGQWRQQVRFLTEPDPDDPVVRSHYRMMRHFTADDPKPLVPGGVPCVRLEVCGDSFMLHQIRHMVGAAVAIVRGILPRELLELSLSAPGRVTLPRAPPHSLLLYGSQFSPFPAGWALDTPLVARYSGDRLSLREGGQQLREEFRQKIFNAAINELLMHPDWELWSRRVLPRYLYAAEDWQLPVEQHREWFTDLKAKRANDKQEAEAAAAVAAAVAGVEGEAEAATEAGKQSVSS